MFLLIGENKDPENLFHLYQISEHSHSIMLNWEAIHECEDECDTDQLREQAQHMTNQTSSSQSDCLT